MAFQQGVLAHTVNRPISRRQAFGIVAAAVTAVVLRRMRPTDAAVAETVAWQPPPAYDGIVGVL
jgi:hypothetical protein